MPLDKKLESLIHAGDLCVNLQKDMYHKIQDHYKLSDKTMKTEWVVYQRNHFMKYSDKKLYIE